MRNPKRVYPIVLTSVGDIYAVSIPDLDIVTQGRDLPEAMSMARDAICVKLCFEQNLGRTEFPARSLDVKVDPGQTLALVDVDIEAYRFYETRTVRKICTIPTWLDAQAERAGIDFSQVLQDALKEKLETQRSPW